MGLEILILGGKDDWQGWVMDEEGPVDWTAPCDSRDEAEVEVEWLRAELEGRVV